MSKYKLFTPYLLSEMTDTAIRREYSRLRGIANKRLDRLAKAGLNQTALSGYKYPTIAEIEESSRSTIASELADVSKWLRQDTSTVKGEREHVKNFQNYLAGMGAGDIVDTPGKLYEFFDFLDDVRERYRDVSQKPSDPLLLDVADILTEGERLNIPREMLIDNFKLFREHLDDMEKIVPTKGGRKFSSQRMNALVNRWT